MWNRLINSKNKNEYSITINATKSKFKCQNNDQ